MLDCVANGLDLGWEVAAVDSKLLEVGPPDVLIDRIEQAPGTVVGIDADDGDRRISFGLNLATNAETIELAECSTLHRLNYAHKKIR